MSGFVAKNDLLILFGAGLSILLISTVFVGGGMAVIMGSGGLNGNELIVGANGPGFGGLAVGIFLGLGFGAWAGCSLCCLAMPCPTIVKVTVATPTLLMAMLKLLFRDHPESVAIDRYVLFVTAFLGVAFVVPVFVYCARKISVLSRSAAKNLLDEG